MQKVELSLRTFPPKNNFKINKAEIKNRKISEQKMEWVKKTFR